MVWNGLITIDKINGLPSMQPKMIALNPDVMCFPIIICIHLSFPL